MELLHRTGADERMSWIHIGLSVESDGRHFHSYYSQGGYCAAVGPPLESSPRIGYMVNRSYYHTYQTLARNYFSPLDSGHWLTELFAVVNDDDDDAVQALLFPSLLTSTLRNRNLVTQRTELRNKKTLD